MAITVQQIHDAASKINAGGVRPTLAAVRAALGGGSFSTIQEAMKTWEAAPVDAPPESEVPEDVQDVNNSALSKIWALACLQATNNLTSQKAESDSLVAAAQSSLHEALGAIAILEHESKQREAVYTDLMGAYASLQADANKLQASCSLLTTQGAVSDARIVELERLLSAQDLTIKSLTSQTMVKTPPAKNANKNTG